MADFDPAAFLAQNASPAVTPAAVPAAAQQVAQPTDDGSNFDPDAFLKEQAAQEFQGPGETLKAGLRGAVKGVIGSTPEHYIEHNLFRNPNSKILGSEEAHPIAEGIGQAAGLTAGALTGVGEGAVLDRAGAAAAEAVGLAKPLTYFSKVGSSAVKQAAEMAIMQGDDEASKMILNDPNTSAESAIANIGLASALGGIAGGFVTGAVSPLWKATAGRALDSGLNGLTAVLGGKEGGSAVASDLAKAGGIEIPPEFAAKINGEPYAEQSFSKLSQTDTTYAGRKLQDSLHEFNDNIGQKIVETLGHEPSYVDKLPDLDKYSTGKDIGDALHSSLKEQVGPIEDRFEAMNEKLKDSPFTPDHIKQVADQVAQKAMSEGWYKAADDSSQKLADKVIAKLGQQETAEDLKKYITNLRDDNGYGKDTYKAARELIPILSDARAKAISDGIIAKGGTPEHVAQTLSDYNQLNKDYSGLMNKFEDIDQHLKVGKWYGPQSFLTALKDMSESRGEEVLNRLSGKNRADALAVLQNNSPEALAKVRQYHIDNLLKSANSTEGFSGYNFMNNFDKLSPQIKDLVAGQEGQTRLKALSDIQNKMIDETHNWSNTARTKAKLDHGATPLSFLAAMLGHGGAAIAAHVGKLGFTEGNDAIKLATMKFLGSNEPVKAEGFKAMVQMMHNVIKGESVLNKATEAVFKSGAQVLTDKNMPNHADRQKLDKIIEQYQDDPEQMLRLTQGQTGHYMPDHQAALSQTVARQIPYLASLKPHDHETGALDEAHPPGPSTKARYDRALDIANQPAVILDHIKHGTLQQTDLQDVNALYPGLSQRMSQKLTDQMTNHKAADGMIPYHTRMGLSLFLGAPVDSTMQPQNIQAAQPKPQNPAQAPKPAKKGTGTLGKSNKSYLTPSQGAEEDRSNRD